MTKHRCVSEEAASVLAFPPPPPPARCQRESEGIGEIRGVKSCNKGACYL